MVAGYSQNLRENVIDSDHYQSDDEVEPVIIRKKQKRYDQFRKTIETIIIPNEVSQWWVLNTFFNFKGFEQGFRHKKKYPKPV